MIDEAALLRVLLPDRPQTASEPGWATVTQASPLRIRLDGQTDPLDLTPSTIGYAPILGARVLVLWVRGHPVVIAAPSS